ncbi:MAG TPA: prepilin-type N-terminal cleavage/methylation domain-containing protein [Planctomycetota bacterium]|nr:prepilin-type N-terminal cleavage/methylation domain-containing protein [Planctomycetota bacterium]
MIAAPADGRRGFALAELLVATFVLALAAAGAIGVIVTAGRSANAARDRLLAEELSRTALADAAYAAETARALHGGIPCWTPAEAAAAGIEIKPADAYFPACYERRDPRVSPPVGWAWRMHTFSPAAGAYSLDVWVYRGPAELPVNWGRAPDPDVRRERTLLYLQTRVEARGP